MRHYGIFHKKDNQWMRFTNGQLFWTTSRQVALVQFNIFCDGVNDPNWLVKQFESDIKIQERSDSHNKSH
jgi:hypothetical protein